jgi:hypothetical protein
MKKKRGEMKVGTIVAVTCGKGLAKDSKYI